VRDLDLDLTAGVDEAGRGPLAGPVVAAAVILNPELPIDGLADSKKLSAKRRQMLTLQIKKYALSWFVASASVIEIDQQNILNATMLAMCRAVQGLSLVPDLVLIDGNRVPAGIEYSCRAIVKGDQSEACISAASILAKTHRDALMLTLDQEYPGYGFAAHKGYGTKQHLTALEKLGVTSEHRKSFAPVGRLITSF